MSYGGNLYIGSTDSTGGINVDYYDAATGEATRTELANFEPDDHNNPALVIEEGRPPIAFYCRHGQDGLMRYRISDTNYVAGQALGTFGTEQTIDFEAALTGTVTYALAFVHGTDLYVWCRCRFTFRWGFVKSSDWGLTWTTPAEVFSSTKQFYMGAALVGDTIRCAISSHPVNGSPLDQNIYYAEIDLLTGDISADGPVIGNIDGTSLPIDYTTLEVVGTTPAGSVTWCYDVSDAADPEVVWSSWDTGDLAGTSMYHYAVKTSGAWTTNDIVAAGAKFPTGSEPYLGGAQMPSDTPGGVVWVCREDAGAWYMEKRTTADGGQTWTTTPYLTDETGVVRGWPVEQRDAVAPPWPAVANWIVGEFAEYYNFDMFIGAGRPRGERQ